MPWQTRHHQQGLPQLLSQNLRDKEREGDGLNLNLHGTPTIQNKKFPDVTEKLSFLYYNNLLVRVIIILKLWYNV